MRVVTYARVSTLRQESDGESLANQERAFARWLAAEGVAPRIRVRAYREAKSAGDVAGRAEFGRMIAELATTKPDAIVVDTLDRFTRDATDGLLLLRQLRGHGVGLLPLDWRRAAPIDLDDDRDWQDVYDEFGAAERERRRIRRRVVRSYEGRRERGATTANRTPLGVRKNGDRLEPSADAWLIVECDRRLLAGESMRTVFAWMRSVMPTSWATLAALNRAMRNEAYVAAGVRSADAHARIGAIVEENATRFGVMLKRKHDHEFTGVFACARCGYRMKSIVVRGGTQERLVCDRRLDHPAVSIVVDERVTSWWSAALRELRAGAGVERWARGEDREIAELRRGLQRQLAACDQRAADLRRRQDRAFDLLVDGDPAIEERARDLLRGVNADVGALELHRATVADELAKLPEPAARDAAAVRFLVEQIAQRYPEWSIEERGRLNRALCAAFGSSPRIERVGRREIAITWDVLAAVHSET
jgi:DNA invertase Pin-like site-specific DNA recombinase